MAFSRYSQLLATVQERFKTDVYRALTTNLFSDFLLIEVGQREWARFEMR